MAPLAGALTGQHSPPGKGMGARPYPCPSHDKRSRLPGSNRTIFLVQKLCQTPDSEILMQVRAIGSAGWRIAASEAAAAQRHGISPVLRRGSWPAVPRGTTGPPDRVATAGDLHGYRKNCAACSGPHKPGMLRLKQSIGPRVHSRSYCYSVPPDLTSRPMLLSPDSVSLTHLPESLP